MFPLAHCLSLLLIILAPLVAACDPYPCGTAYDMSTGRNTTPHIPQRATLDVDSYPVAPPELELQQVHVYVRHGERTPVGVRLNTPPASVPENWIMCKAAERFRALAIDGSIDIASSAGVDAPPRVVERKDGSFVHGECLLGELTDVGRQSTHNFGRALRAIYIDKLNLLPDTLRDPSNVYFRSTNMPRTIESLEHVVRGLYPAKRRASGVAPPLFVRNGKDENLLGNTYFCQRLAELQIGFARAAATKYNSALEPFDKKLAKYLNGNPLRVDGKPRASGILDTVRAAVAHGVKVPSEFEDRAIVDVIETAVVNEWFAGYKTEEVRRLGMGRLLADAVAKMTAPAAPRLLVHSTHDTALAALLSTLDVFDERWPAFTASITLELFRARTHPSTLQRVLGGAPAPEYYVRMRYQNATLALPVCAAEGRHLPGAPEFCTLGAFRARVAELTPRDFDAECAEGAR